ncbi:MAG: restriction endonuclease [Candidatus Asgardarchaeia archaeon]
MSKIRGASAERIARYILEKIGYKIIKENEIFKIGNVEIAEIDFIAESPNGEKFVVEVKAGDVDVSTIRNIYANAKVLKMKPLIIGRGYSNDAAKKLAEELGVKVVSLSDFFILLDPLELEVIIRGALRDILYEYGFKPIHFNQVDQADLKKMYALVTSENIEDFLNKTNLTEKEFGKFIQKLKKKGILPKGSMNFEKMKTYMDSILFWVKIQRKLEEIDSKLTEVITLLKEKEKEK